MKLLSDKTQCHQTELEVETYDDSNPPSWLESLKASQGQKVIEAIQHLHVERFIDPESGLIVEKLIDPNAEHYRILMELVYNPETDTGQIIRICGGGGGWTGPIGMNVLTYGLSGTTIGYRFGSRRNILGGAVGAVVGGTIGVITGIGAGIWGHWKSYHSEKGGRSDFDLNPFNTKKARKMIQ